LRTIAGRFRIEDEVASGGMGRVFRAVDQTTGDTVAVKLLRSHEEMDPDRFAREAALLASLDDPGIVKYVAHGVEGDFHYLVMEWVAGETVARRLSTTGMTVDEAVAVTAQAAAALGSAHRHGLVHRDVKPENLVFVGGGGRVKLIDFGLARAARDAQGLTRSGLLLGTPGYMAPEQAEGMRDLDVRVDVFALGCVLYEALTGRPAFEGVSQLALRTKVLLGEPAPLAEACPEAPVRLVALVERMLAKDRALRQLDGAEVARELARVGAVGASTRRRTVDPAGPTQALSRSASAVIVVPPEAIAAVVPPPPDAFLERRRAEVRKAADAAGARLAALADGSLVAVAGDVRRAARCASEIRRLVPGAVVVLASGTALDEALDRGVEIAEDEALHVMFDSDDGPLAVRLDAESGRALPAAEVRVDGGRLYLRELAR
jgi:hypothetical protein